MVVEDSTTTASVGRRREASDDDARFRLEFDAHGLAA
jgi:hypothetical protein